MTTALHTGDCLDVMRGLPDNSIDSIVTDPPYGISFMGKAWDKGVPSVEVWREALRVLKPGGHLLAFAGTRTQHRMAVAIEDAGFEIRDMIAWVYSTGFPKSHNLDKKRGDLICGCDEDALPYTHEKIPGKPQAECHLHPMRDSDVSEALDSSEGRGQVLQPSLPEQGAPAKGRAQLWPTENGCKESGMEGWRDDQKAEGKLPGRSVCQSTEVGKTDGAQGRLCNGAPSCDGENVRILTDANGGGPSYRPQSSEQQPQQSGTVADKRGSQAGGVWPLCSGCGKPRLPKGLGTALKPALEPITVARKPLAKGNTVAANVLEYGTGAINVDGGRVETDATQGRFPANLIHDGSDEVTGLFPVTKTHGGGKATYGGTFGNGDEITDKMAMQRFAGDSGSAARFFYCAKASKADRDDGCGGLLDKEWRHEGAAIPERENRPFLPSKNHHPTVKPTDLMRYLCRLVTPPCGTVLDPFMGSGSTGRGAVLEGFAFTGIDLEPEYVEIARARIEAAQSKAEDDAKQGNLFT